MAVNIPKLGTSKVYNYHYDQLNRIVAMDVYNGLDVSAGTFVPVNNQLTDYKERISYDPNGNILSYLRNGDAARPSMDDLTYNYTLGTNRLHKVTDQALDASAADYSKYNDIKQGQADDNYEYDAIGNLTKDHFENLDISWTAYGKIASISKPGGVTNFAYDAADNRILKVSPSGSTAYVRDGDGIVMSVYSQPSGGSFAQTEVHLYGSKRLGMVTTHSVSDAMIVLGCGFNNGTSRTFTRGEKLFELSNHLGNVLATVTDKKIAFPAAAPSTSIDHYEADLASAQDYYPFGMLQPGRKWNAGGYRYGFNGKENDNDVKGEGNQQDYGMRIYDPRIGKFLSVDPLTCDYPDWSPYPFGMNRPIDGVDLDGGEWKPYYGASDKNKEHSLGYSWVGYNLDGTPKSGTVASGIVQKGDYDFWFTSDSKSKTGEIDILSRINAPTMHVEGQDRSTLYNYHISVYQDLGGLIFSVDNYVWNESGRSATMWLKSGIWDDHTDNYYFNQLKDNLGLKPPQITIDADYPETYFLPLGPKGMGALKKGVSFVENAFAHMAPLAEKGIGFTGAAYFKIGTKILGEGFARIHPRLNTIGFADIRGMGFGQFDAGHRAAAFFRSEILNSGKLGVKNWKTIYYNITIGGKDFSLGINPWTRTIFHEGPGVFR
jgi:RHS repeat-associated protein